MPNALLGPISLDTFVSLRVLWTLQTPPLLKPLFLFPVRIPDYRSRGIVKRGVMGHHRDSSQVLEIDAVISRGAERKEHKLLQDKLCLCPLATPPIPRLLCIHSNDGAARAFGSQIQRLCSLFHPGNHTIRPQRWHINLVAHTC